MQPPKALAPQSALSEDDTVQVTVELDCHVSAPAYGSLVFTAANGRDTVVLLKPDAKATGKLKARMPAADLKPQVRRMVARCGPLRAAALTGRRMTSQRSCARMQGPEHEVTVYVGDPQMAPLQVALGAISIMQRGGAAKVPPAKQSRRSAQYAAKPEILHAHRPEHQQPPALVPLAASVAVLAPLAAWLALLSRLPLNAKALPPGGTGRAAAGAFHALIAAALAFAVYYWLRMRLVDALLPLAGLAAAMVLVGHRALSGLAERRIAKEGKAAKKD